MAHIEGMRVQNYRSLRDVTLGALWKTQGRPKLSPFTAVIGKNGSGKSTLLDVFGFLADALRVGVEDACDLQGRGGFERIRSHGVTDPIRIEIYYRHSPSERPITYELAIDADESGRPYVAYERLRQRRRGVSSGAPFFFLWLRDGEGVAWNGDSNLAVELGNSDRLEEMFRITEHEEPGRVNVRMADNRRLGISTLGTLKDHPRIAGFRQFIEGWYLSYFTPDAARSIPQAGPQKRLNMHGDNVGNVVQYLEREHPEKLERILKEIAGKIPGITKITAQRTVDGRVVLQFNERGFVDPFYAQQMSDGTLKVFAYLLLLADPNPPPFLCIEEPENGLYHKLLAALATELRAHATSPKGASQVFVTTHQPYLVDAMSPEEVWMLTRGDDGFSHIRRASESPIVKALVEEGLPLGGLWFSDYLDGV